MKSSDELKQQLYQLEDEGSAYLKEHYRKRDTLLAEIKQARAREIEEKYGLRIGMVLTVNQTVIDLCKARLTITGQHAELNRAIVNGKITELRVVAYNDYLDSDTTVETPYGRTDMGIHILVTML